MRPLETKKEKNATWTACPETKSKGATSSGFFLFLEFLSLLGFFHLLFEFGALLGLDLVTLLALVVELLFGAEQFDEGLFAPSPLRKPVRMMRR